MTKCPLGLDNHTITQWQTQRWVGIAPMYLRRLLARLPLWGLCYYDGIMDLASEEQGAVVKNMLTAAYSSTRAPGVQRFWLMPPYHSWYYSTVLPTIWVQKGLPGGTLKLIQASTKGGTRQTTNTTPGSRVSKMNGGPFVIERGPKHQYQPRCRIFRTRYLLYKRSCTL